MSSRWGTCSNNQRHGWKSHSNISVQQNGTNFCRYDATLVTSLLGEYPRLGRAVSVSSRVGLGSPDRSLIHSQPKFNIHVIMNNTCTCIDESTSRVYSGLASIRVTFFCVTLRTRYKLRACVEFLCGSTSASSLYRPGHEHIDSEVYVARC